MSDTRTDDPDEEFREACRAGGIACAGERDAARADGRLVDARRWERFANVLHARVVAHPMSDDGKQHYVDVARRLWAVACILEDVADERRTVPRGELLAARFEVFRAKWALEKVAGVKLPVESLPRTLA